MKILHVLDTSIPDSAGYTTRGLYLVKHQRQQGVDPVVLTSERFRTSWEADVEEIEGVRYYRTRKRTSIYRKLPFLAVICEIADLSKRIKDVAAIEQIDIVHTHSPSLIGSAGLKYCQFNNIPLIYEIRAFWEDAAVDRGAFKEGSLHYKLRRAHETGVVKRADKVIVICEGLKQDLLARGVSEDKIHVVKNGVDYDHFLPVKNKNDLREKLHLNNKEVVGFVGSFFNFEGLQDMIRSMPQILAANGNVVLLLVGAGQVDDNLRELSKSLNIEDKVIFTGRVPHDSVNDYYSIIDILVYPRIKKRITDLVTPLKPLEAMAMGKAVLMSDVGGLRELVNVDGVAEFFRAEDLNDLAAKILKMLKDKNKLEGMGKKARRNAIEYWGWNRRAAEDIQIYNSLLRN